MQFRGPHGSNSSVLIAFHRHQSVPHPSFRRFAGIRGGFLFCPKGHRVSGSGSRDQFLATPDCQAEPERFDRRSKTWGCTAFASTPTTTAACTSCLTEIETAVWLELQLPSTLLTHLPGDRHDLLLADEVVRVYDVPGYFVGWVPPADQRRPGHPEPQRLSLVVDPLFLGRLPRLLSWRFG